MPRKPLFQNVIFVFVLGLVSPQLGEAVDLSSGSWKTTYNCADQVQGDGIWVTCDGIQSYGDWLAPGNLGEHITAAANMTSGGGGLGQRHWIGAGRNSNSGSVKVCFDTPKSEFWLRYYTRWQSGFYMSGQHSQKMIYSADTAGRPYIDLYGNDGLRVVANTTYQVDAGVWNTMFKGQVSDGSWHEFQFHLKAAGADGMAEVWVDGRKILSVANDWGSIASWQCFKYPENMDSNATGLTMFQDVDDVAISTTGYITPLIAGSVDAPPAAPQNLTVN